jgi:hypothetical protein
LRSSGKIPERNKLDEENNSIWFWRFYWLSVITVHLWILLFSFHHKWFLL